MHKREGKQVYVHPIRCAWSKCQLPALFEVGDKQYCRAHSRFFNNAKPIGKRWKGGIKKLKPRKK